MSSYLFDEFQTVVLLLARITLQRGQLPLFSEQDNPAAFAANRKARYIALSLLATRHRRRRRRRDFHINVRLNWGSHISVGVFSQANWKSRHKFDSFLFESLFNYWFKPGKSGECLDPASEAAQTELGVSIFASQFQKSAGDALGSLKHSRCQVKSSLNAEWLPELLDRLWASVTLVYRASGGGPVIGRLIRLDCDPRSGRKIRRNGHGCRLLVYGIGKREREKEREARLHRQIATLLSAHSPPLPLLFTFFFLFQNFILFHFISPIFFNFFICYTATVGDAEHLKIRLFIIFISVVDIRKEGKKDGKIRKQNRKT